MENRVPPRRGPLENTWWDLQPRDRTGHFLSYTGRSPKAEAAAREAEKLQQHERVQESMENLKGQLLSQFLLIMVRAPAPVQRAMAGLDAPPATWYV